MASKLQFKLDPASLPKLTSRGDRYNEWRSAWTMAFRYAGLWPIVSKKKARPVEPPLPVPDAATEAINAWDEEDSKAMTMLLSAVHNDLAFSITSCDTSAKAWEHLGSRFGRETDNTSTLLFRSLTNFRYRDSEDLQPHLNGSYQRWARKAKRCISSNQNVAVAMTPIFESDEESKAHSS